MAQWTEEAARKRIAKAKSAKQASDEIYREAMELTFPHRENFTKTAEGQDKAVSNWDGAATVNVIRAANRLSSDFTPQHVDWFEIGLGAAAEAMEDETFKERMGRTKEEVKRELEKITTVVQAVFNGPGFPTAANELYIDWHFGQGGMSIMGNSDPQGEPIVFQAMPISHFYAYEGPNSRLDQWFFWHELRPDAVKEQWPDAKETDYILEQKTRPEQKPVEFCAVVYRDYDSREYRYEVFQMRGRNCERIVERSYRTPPFVTPRYSKLPGENRGRGPVLFAMPDIRTANKIVELTLRGVAVAIAGVYTAVENSIDGPVQIKPYGIITVRSNGGPSGPSLQRLDQPQRVDFGQLLLEQLHEAIKKTIGDNSLPSEAGPIRTATEFVQRARELIADQSGGLGRLYGEFIIPAVQRVVDLLERRQILPTEGLVIDQFLIEVRMTSPLAKAEAMQEVQNVATFIEILRQLGGPQGGDALVGLEVDLTKLPAWMADQMDVPMAIRTTDEQKGAAIQAFSQRVNQYVANQEAAGAAAAGGAPMQGAA